MTIRERFRHLRLRHLVFLLLPPASSPGHQQPAVDAQEPRDLRDQEKTSFTNFAKALSREVGDYVEATRRQLAQLGRVRRRAGADGAGGKAARRVGGSLPRRLPAEQPAAGRPARARPRGRRSSLGPQDLAPAAAVELNTAFEQARSHGRPIYRFVAGAAGNQPLAVIAVPVGLVSGTTMMVVEAVRACR
jgi:hypothetical protein